MEYNFREIEQNWQRTWQEEGIYKVNNNSPKPKYYVLDMFPYPSGAGLHVGHPLGYIASDIYARFKRLKGFNVLHPMGYDAFGLPAEQYAIEHGVHPAESTQKNIANFRSQLDKIGFCFDWSREVNTSDPKYYKWTQWIFLQLFKSWYNKETDRAEPIETLIEKFEKSGSNSINYQPSTTNFSADEWNHFTEKQQQDILMNYRLCYCGYGEVNWCEALGTVLANDEVINGVSERGGYPVVKKKLRQWYLRITDYADRLLKGLQTVDFSDAMKEMQSNWIGKSYGAEIDFAIRSDKFTTVEDSEHRKLRVYTTRPDTIFGVDFMVISPEHELINLITTDEKCAAVDEYIAYVKSRSERERMAEKKITGVFTGGYAINRFNNAQIPIWISEYVLAGYGTGAIMAVPCGDERDFKFAKHFNIPITNIIGDFFNGEEANPTKDATLTNSDFLNGMLMRDAIEVVIANLEQMGDGKRKVNYKMRDAAFSRQRYWGEPFPIIWKDGIAYPMNENELPLELPYVEKYGPGPEGEGPLANVKEWVLIPNPSPQVEKGAFGTAAEIEEKQKKEGAANVPKYGVYAPVQYELAKLMRKEYTEAEDVLWQALRNNQLEVKFRRQHPVDAYIVDFIALQNNLIVEVDGDYHNSIEQKEYDENRTQILNEIGFTVVRFTNEAVLNNLSFVLETIKNKLQKAAVPNTPFSTRGEGQGMRETNTMPGYAGSSWYFLRYMDPHNNQTFCDKKVSDYWNQVDVYVGGTEHAVGHLLYSRMWTKFLFDRGYISFDEPFKRLVNQGMIQGSSRFVYRILPMIISQPSDFKIPPTILISHNIVSELESSNETKIRDAKQRIVTAYSSLSIGIDENIVYTKIHVDVNIVDGVELNIEAFKRWRNGEYANAEFILEDGSFYSPFSTRGEGSGMRYICGVETEKMSKSKFNTVNPDDLVNRYGADTFRMYEMFLGPVEQSKPWDTKGIEGVHRFLKKLWRLFNDEVKGKVWNEEKASPAELKILHKAIKKIEDDTERFSFNTAVSAFMVCVNELSDAKCNKRELLEPLLIMLAPYAPHIAEELYRQLGNTTSVLDAAYPTLNTNYLIESTKEYPVSINGKLRTTLVLPLDIDQTEAQAKVLNDEKVKKYTDDKEIKKFIFIKGKMINLVV